jgi:glycopeptide antibiotics resistance protein
MSRRRFYFGLLAVYTVIVAIATLIPRPGTAATTLSLVPFRQTWHMVAAARDRADVFVPVLGNVALFVPLGWLLPMTWPRLRSLRWIVVAGASCSAAIEVCQILFVSGRSPTIDDVIFNTLGAAIGGIMFFAPRAA